ncbi:hypothetical protein [Paractinoplanes toevensis]|uniref:Uncharacterized protein n=1 Tax=Paractinoplanes toevensis TaxID=571911 RepID=A0A919T759_9ACTN|nr:hypothetical protein [Actinoplanes toevensis]GIM90103.1 hypothetical protein Ato02nite_018960 [Actinoplanes toevensis]
MTIYQSGQRILLIRTSDPHTALRPGALGTVRRHHRHTNIVDIDFDTADSVSMRLDDANQIAAVDQPTELGHPTGTGDTATRPGPTASGMTDGTFVHVVELPNCDIHLQMHGMVVPAGYDGATRLGPWANMCPACFTLHGRGLGIGRGQRLLVEGAGWIARWLGPGDDFRGEPLTEEQAGIELFDGTVYVDNRQGLAELGHALARRFTDPAPDHPPTTTAADPRHDPPDSADDGARVEELLDELIRHAAQNPRIFVGRVRLECVIPDVEDPWEVGRIWRYGNTFYVAPDIDGDSDADINTVGPTP